MDLIKEVIAHLAKVILGPVQQTLVVGTLRVAYTVAAKPVETALFTLVAVTHVVATRSDKTRFLAVAVAEHVR